MRMTYMVHILAGSLALFCGYVVLMHAAINNTRDVVPGRVVDRAALDGLLRAVRRDVVGPL
jgi:hypothetical protein